MRFIASVIQMSAEGNVQNNLAMVADLISQAKKAGARLVVLPENFYFMGRSSERLDYAEKIGAGPLQAFLAQQAKTHQLVIVAGTIPLCSPRDDRIFSCCLVFNEEGQYITHYNKIHLFDVSVPEGEAHLESAIFTPGDKVVVAKTTLASIGLSICYDLRFPELFRKLLEQQAQLLTVPAAFTYVSGKAHWLTLLKARAVENQCYVLAANQCGEHRRKFKTYGHSVIIDPWGNVLVEADDSTVGVYSAEIDLESQQQLRQSFPVLEHRVL